MATVETREMATQDRCRTIGRTRTVTRVPNVARGSRVEMIAQQGRGQFSYVRSIEEVPLAITRCLTA